MGHPAYQYPEHDHPDVDHAETHYAILSTLTTTLHYERALNAHDAFGQWARRHGLTGRVLAGRQVEEPIKHLDLVLETDASGELHEVHVVAERALCESRGGGPRPC